MTPIDVSRLGGEGFARALLDSGRADPKPPPDVTALAWMGFAETGLRTSLSLSHAGADQVSAVRPRRHEDEGHAGGWRSAWRRSEAVKAAKWLVVGAVGGGIVGAGWFGAGWFGAGRDEVTAPRLAPSLARTLSSGEVVEAAVDTLGGSSHESALLSPSDGLRGSALLSGAVTSNPAGGGADSASTLHRGQSQRKRQRLGNEGATLQVGTARPGSAQSGEHSASDASSLGAEVAALDAARHQLGLGRPDAAISRIEQYRLNFPHGMLAPDAEVLFIEALAQKRDVTAVREAAARFLTLHPGDPHAARVRALGKSP